MRLRGPRAIAAKAHQALCETLDTQPPCECGDQRDPSIRDDALVVEDRLTAVQLDRRIVHHEGDLLTPGPAAHTAVKNPCSGGHYRSLIGQNDLSAAVDSGLTGCSLDGAEGLPFYGAFSGIRLGTN